ncbi:MAG: 30S ribosomal protein S13 [Candidatus Methanoperedenaceae archaeon]|nr:MAG: 30S ribosomal protein S13 [Candidatus Methanoperedenaceae archaeon]
MAKKEEIKEVKETKKEAPKKEAPKQEAIPEPKKEKKQEKKHEGKGEGKEHEKKDRKGAPKGKKDTAIAKEAGPEIKHFVRIANTDLDGKKSVQYGLIGIKGISRRTAKILIVNSNVDPKATLGYIADPDIERLQSSVDSISSILPVWMVNKQNEIMSGEDRHLIGTDVLLGLNEDLNTMKKMRSYKGLRHDRGLRVRGQRTRSSGRRGRTVGVSRTALMAKPKEAEKKEETKGAGK